MWRKLWYDVVSSGGDYERVPTRNQAEIKQIYCMDASFGLSIFLSMNWVFQDYDITFRPYFSGQAASD